MKNQFLALIVILSLSVFGLTGCDGNTDTTVVQPTDQEEAGLSAEEQAEYEQEMMAEQGN
jgi:hypothetical protein